MTHDVSNFLPEAIARSLGSYQEFSERLPDGSAKNFSAYHSACKAALGHLAALLKLGALCQKQTPSSDKQDNLELLLQQARTILVRAHSNDSEKDQL